MAGCSGFREAGLRELAHHELARDWRAPGDGHLQVRRFEHSREQPERDQRADEDAAEEVQQQRAPADQQPPPQTARAFSDDGED